jgi:type IV pilus assembly protein PilA
VAHSIVQRYIRASLVAEAKGHVGAITRGGHAAWERHAEGRGLETNPSCFPGIDETMPTGLCESALPVPRRELPGTAPYKAAAYLGQDFNTGDARGGWSCLRFSLEEPLYHQLSYTLGDSEVDGQRVCFDDQCFEAAALADFDGDGTPDSILRRSAAVEPDSGWLASSDILYVVDDSKLF